MAGGRIYRATRRRRKTSKINRLEKRIKKVEMGDNLELKTSDDVPFYGTVGSTWTVQHITGIAQGDTSLTRDGLQIRLKNLQYRLNVSKDAASARTLVRVVIFVDRENNGVAPTADEVLEGVTPTYMDFAEHDTRPRFKILKDMIFDMQDSSKIAFFKKGYKKLKLGTTYFRGTSSTVASAYKNHVFVMAQSSDNTNQPFVHMHTRVRWVEK